MFRQGSCRQALSLVFKAFEERGIAPAPSGAGRYHGAIRRQHARVLRGEFTQM